MSKQTLDIIQHSVMISVGLTGMGTVVKYEERNVYGVLHKRLIVLS